MHVHHLQIVILIFSLTSNFPPPIKKVSSFFLARFFNCSFSSSEKRPSRVLLNKSESIPLSLQCPFEMYCNFYFSYIMVSFLTLCKFWQNVNISVSLELVLNIFHSSLNISRNFSFCNPWELNLKGVWVFYCYFQIEGKWVHGF